MLLYKYIRYKKLTTLKLPRGFHGQSVKISGLEAILVIASHNASVALSSTVLTIGAR